MDISQFVQTVAIYALPVLFAITLHEAAHGYVARHFGDMTAYAQGRISLNPARHIDLIGTIIVPIALLLTTGGKFAFGWAKPVPVNYSALRKPKPHMALVAAAGPTANLAMLLAWAILLKLGLELPRNSFSAPLLSMAVGGVLINFVLMAFNLIPILPLDGGRIVAGLLPDSLERLYSRSERLSSYLLGGFVIFGVLDSLLNNGAIIAKIFRPMNDYAEQLVRAIVNA